MTEFTCKVTDDRGQISLLTERAETEGELRQRLNERGLFPLSIRRRGGLPAVTPGILDGRRRRLSQDEFVLFNQQFVTLVRAGLPIMQALELLAGRAARPGLRSVLADVRQRVRGGASLSDAFAAQGIFPEVYTTALLAGERSGNLPGVLEQYIAYQKITGGLRRRLLTTLVYPALLVLVSAGVLSYVILYVVPQFSALYGEMQQRLPALTLTVLRLAQNARTWALVLVILGVAAAVGMAMASRSQAGAQFLDRLRLGLPIAGDILLKFRLTQFCRTLGTLLSSGIPLVASLEVVGSAVGSPVLARAIGGAAQGVREGKSLHQALEETGLVPGLVTEMIEVGESTGALPAMLNSVSEFYEEELDARLARLIALVEPLMLLTVGGIVLIILIALYLPVFSLGSLVRG
ncbi:MAG TPA: type II secretion system F family protein [Candidatus Xenobia bacterium]|nr:type II secretion system F family protein [Candidatus Xenobia bacterium]